MITPPLVTIRALGAADAVEYRSFRLSALRADPSAFTSTFDEENARPVAATVERLVHMGHPSDVVLGAFATSALVGIAGLTVPIRRQIRHAATLFGMAVAAHAAGQGIGRALVLDLLDRASAVEGLLQVKLSVSEGNERAERLYRSCGFVVWGREPRAVIVDDRAVTKLHMVRMLDGTQ